MANGTRRPNVTAEERRKMYDLWCSGAWTMADIARQYGCAESTVHRQINAQREEQGMSKQTVIAGDKRNGRLSSMGEGRYEGTHLMADGSMERWKFSARSPHEAMQKWARWAGNLDDQQAFLDRIERKAPAKADDLADAPDEVPADNLAEDPAEVPTDDSDETPADDLAEAPSDAPSEAPAEDHAEEPDHAEPLPRGCAMVDMGKPTYVVVAVRPTLRCWGTYLSLTTALGKAEELNEVSAMLGMKDAFDVVESPWRTQ